MDLHLVEFETIDGYVEIYVHVDEDDGSYSVISCTVCDEENNVHDVWWETYKSEIEEVLCDYIVTDWDRENDGGYFGGYDNYDDGYRNSL